MLRFLCFTSIVLVGCTDSANTSQPNSLTDISWDLSTDRSADRFSWFDFDPIRGAIDGPHQLELRFDDCRSFRGKTDLIVITRDGAGTAPLSGVSINLSPMTAEQVTAKLWSLANDWSLPSDRLTNELPAMLDDRLKRGVLLFERGNPDIAVEFFSSFDKERPFSLTISWSWTDS